MAADDFTLDGLHILLAEDNDINAEIAIEILKLDLGTNKRRKKRTIYLIPNDL